ncbi:ribosomal protein L29 family protein [Abeliophyllum distichum]|uniref:Large ribosomal subunit protein uL29m n=1 Tax=Abeliophyllum distichum TaxID=126358 RepID=A0ABD1T154_9LAMI
MSQVIDGKWFEIDGWTIGNTTLVTPSPCLPAPPPLTTAINLPQKLSILGRMFLTRVFGRTLFAAARSEASATGAAAASTIAKRNPLEEFFEADRSPDDDKPVVYGRSWKAPELRLKSWDDLNKLWYVLLKEKNMLMTQRQMLNAQNLRFPNPERIPKVRKSMCRIKHVLTERAIEEPDPRRSAEMKRMINAL